MIHPQPEREPQPEALKRVRDLNTFTVFAILDEGPTHPLYPEAYTYAYDEMRKAIDSLDVD